MTGILAILQARYSSSRLPGKVLRPLQGRPMLEWTVERLERCRRLDGIVLATSRQDDDDAVAAWAARRGVACWRGPLDDVAGRFAQVVRHKGCRAFVRINGDSPLIDPVLIDHGVALFDAEGPLDLVTNIHPRSYPPGQSVEVVDGGAFLALQERLSEPGDKEHVTKYFYRHPEQFRIRNFSAPQPFPGLHMAIDTAEDWARLEACVGRMTRPHWEYGLEELCALWTEANA
jgi:spore coat polysaccharide biosynthesis protein SpsF